MKVNVRIIRPTRIEKGRAGDIIAVSPDRARFLIMYGLAEPVTIREQIETPEKRTAKKKTAEAEKAEKTEVPEKQTAGRTTRTAKAEPEKETKTAKAARKKA